MERNARVIHDWAAGTYLLISTVQNYENFNLPKMSYKILIQKQYTSQHLLGKFRNYNLKNLKFFILFLQQTRLNPTQDR